jgi:DNA polymerase
MPVRKVAAKSALDYLPEGRDLTVLREAAAHCKGCDLYLKATQTVFGEGRRGATVFFVGEQPGDKEDQLGEPFVGPAGKLLDACMEEAGIDRKAAYVTNAVKHFKWEPRGKLRIHKKPGTQEVAACRPWLEAEIEAVAPKLIVCLGATAAQAFFGSSFRVTADRGRLIDDPNYPSIMATVHPSSILRARDEETRQRERQMFVADLKKAAQILA